MNDNQRAMCALNREFSLGLLDALAAARDGDTDHGDDRRVLDELQQIVGQMLALARSE